MDGDRHEFTRGHSIRVPAGTPHAIRAADGEGAETLNVFPAESS